MCPENQRLVKNADWERWGAIQGPEFFHERDAERGTLKMCFDATAVNDYHRGAVWERVVRQFIYGVICGLGFWYMYERLDPPAVLTYLNSSTEAAVKSTSGYGGGTHNKK